MLDLLEWIKRYNTVNNDTIRVLGIGDFSTAFPLRQMGNYLFKLSTTRQDSVYFQRAVTQPIVKAQPINSSFSEIADYILNKSKIPSLLDEKDLKYLLFLVQKELPSAYLYPTGMYSPEKEREREKEREMDMAKRVEKVIDIYLSQGEKAVLLADFRRVNRGEPIRDIRDFENFRRLGYYLNEKYKEQYHAVIFHHGKSYPAEPYFPFSFDQAGMNTGSTFFYYPANQLPTGILGLTVEVFIDGSNLSRIPFRFCHVPSHFDALVFTRGDEQSEKEKSLLKQKDLEEFIERFRNPQKRDSQGRIISWGIP